MTERTYPYTAWVLLPSFKPKEVELVRKYGGTYQDYGDLTESRKLYAPSEIYASKQAAIDAGWAAIAKQQADIEKRTERLNKRRAQLNKALQEQVA